MTIVLGIGPTGLPRVVLDTNVLVSATIRNGKARRLLKKATHDKEYVIVLSDDAIKELSDVLSRPKFGINKKEIGKTVDAIVSASDVKKIKSGLKVVAADPDDDVFINAAYDGKADYIVSGDSDLLDVKKFRKIRIVTINEMLEILQKKKKG